MNDKEWDVFKESVSLLKRKGRPNYYKKNYSENNFNQTTRTTADLETVLSEWET